LWSISPLSLAYSAVMPKVCAILWNSCHMCLKLLSFLWLRWSCLVLRFLTSDMFSEELPWSAQMLVVLGLHDIEMTNPLLWILAFLIRSYVDCRSKRRVQSFPMGNWRSLVRFHERNSLLVVEACGKYSLLLGSVRILDLCRFMCPWRLCPRDACKIHAWSLYFIDAYSYIL
jgi:hypothetical protein